MNTLKGKETKDSPLIPWVEVVRNPKQTKPEKNSPGYKYWNLCSEIHHLFNALYEDGSLIIYGNFLNHLEALHKKFEPPESTLPPFRVTYCVNNYVKEANFTIYIAKTLHDPFGMVHTKTERISPNLPSIPKPALPLNFCSQHAYPSPSYFSLYFKEAHKHLLESLNHESSLINRLKSVALIYSYLINARAFLQNNNSYYMVIVNVILKKLGLNGISHYILDHNAQRLHHRNFFVLFLSTVVETNPSICVLSPQREDNSHLAKAWFRCLLKSFSCKKSEILGYLKTTLQDLMDKFPESESHHKKFIDALYCFFHAPKDGRFPFAPILPEDLSELPYQTNEFDLFVFCAQWYDTLYPTRNYFSISFPVELPRADADQDTIRRYFR